MANTAAAAPVVAAPTAVDATPAAAPASPAAPARVKVGDKEYDPAELEAAVQARSTIDQSLKEIASSRAELEAKLAAVKTPAQLRKLLKEMGADEAKFAEDVLIEAMEYEKLTPEQRELKELRDEKAAAQKAKEDAAKAEADAKVERQTAELRASYEKQFMAAVIDSGLPKTAHTVAQLASIVEDGLEAGYEVTPAEAATIHRARWYESTRAQVESMQPAQVRELIGSAVWQALLKDHQAGLKKQTEAEPDARPAAHRQADRKRQTSTVKSMDDVLASLIRR